MKKYCCYTVQGFHLKLRRILIHILTSRQTSKLTSFVFICTLSNCFLVLRWSLTFDVSGREIFSNTEKQVMGGR